MHETINFLIEHGYTLLFAWVLAEQLGLPIPALPLLLAAGALAGAGKLSFGWAVALAVWVLREGRLALAQLGAYWAKAGWKDRDKRPAKI